MSTKAIWWVPLPLDLVPSLPKGIAADRLVNHVGSFSEEEKLALLKRADFKLLSDKKGSWRADLEGLISWTEPSSDCKSLICQSTLLNTGFVLTLLDKLPTAALRASLVSLSPVIRGPRLYVQETPHEVVSKAVEGWQKGAKASLWRAMLLSKHIDAGLKQQVVEKVLSGKTTEAAFLGSIVAASPFLTEAQVAQLIENYAAGLKVPAPFKLVIALRYIALQDVRFTTLAFVNAFSKDMKPLVLKALAAMPDVDLDVQKEIVATAGEDPSALTGLVFNSTANVELLKSLSKDQFPRHVEWVTKHESKFFYAGIPYSVAELESRVERELARCVRYYTSTNKFATGVVFETAMAAAWLKIGLQRFQFSDAEELVVSTFRHIFDAGQSIPGLGRYDSADLVGVLLFNGVTISKATLPPVPPRMVRFNNPRSWDEEPPGFGILDENCLPQLRGILGPGIATWLLFSQFLDDPSFQTTPMGTLAALAAAM